MAKFDAGTAVEAIEYDLTKYGGGAGVIPEPTNKQVEDFMSAISSLYDDFKDLIDKEKGSGDSNAVSSENSTPASELADVSKALNLFNSKIADAVEGVTGGCIPKHVVENLPFRIQQAFVGWLAGQLRPEARTPGTTN